MVQHSTIEPIEMPHGHSLSHRIQLGPLDGMVLRKEFFQLGYNSSQTSRNQRKTDPIGKMAVKNTRR